MTQQQVPMSIFKIRRKDPKDIKIFLDESGTVDISRSDVVKYPIFEKQADAMFSAMWKFRAVDLSRDKIDFNEALNPQEQFIFTSNLKRQIVLDTNQSMALSQALLPLTSDPMVKRCINIIEFFEELHNWTYEYIIKNVYTGPREVMDGIKDIEPVVRCGEQIGKYYDELILETAKFRLGQTTLHKLKQKLWLTIQSINALEGIRFFVSFACSFSFGNSGRMIGNASEIKLIANDELFHVAFTTKLLRVLPEDDEEFLVIREECKEESEHIFLEVVKDEKDWAKFLFENGSTIGLNEKILSQYLDHIAEKRMRAIGMVYPYEAPKYNPLPWMSKWLNEADFQPAPQETEITSYVTDIENTITGESFGDIEL